jgi:hypothetical protein
MAGQDVKGDMVAPSPANKQPVSAASWLHCSAGMATLPYPLFLQLSMLFYVRGDMPQTLSTAH